MLGAVGDHQHAGAGGGDDLLPQMRGTAALDQAKLIVDLVRAVDREIEFGHLVEGRQRNALGGRLNARRLRRRNSHDLQPCPHTLAQRRHEERRRRSRADAKAHSVGDEGCGALAAARLSWSLTRVSRSSSSKAASLKARAARL